MNPATILFALVTGLTAGGLSCFAVQGGLLTSSIAWYTEQTDSSTTKTKTKRRAAKFPVNRQIHQPILLFLGAKLVVHIIFGFLLGWLGTILSPSPLARGVLQFGLGIFMVGNALRMLNVHPIFRVFSLEPPRAITRMIRRRAKNGAEWTTPVFLGALTILIPCGLTQIMMASAVGSGNPWMGAAILGAFVLGGSPTFFGVSYLAARLTALFEKHFVRALAVMILLLGLYSLDTGLNLVGSPFSVSRAIAGWQGAEVQNSQAQNAQPQNAAGSSSSLAESKPVNGLQQVQLPPALLEGLSTPASSEVNLESGSDVRIDVYNSGYSPRVVHAPAGQALHLKLVTQGVYSCSRAFVIPSLNIQQLLPVSGETSLDLPAQPAGSSLYFMCSMGMFTGQIDFE